MWEGGRNSTGVKVGGGGVRDVGTGVGAVAENNGRGNVGDKKLERL